MRYLSMMVLLVLSFAVATPAFADDPAAPDAVVTTDTTLAPEAVAGPAIVEPDVAPAADVVAPVADPAAAPVTRAVVAPPVTDEEVGATLSAMLDAAKEGHWNMFGGLLILLLVWGFNKLGLRGKFGPKVVPWVALGTGALVAIAVGLAAGASFLDALKLGLLDGALAVALWELIAKHFMKPADPAA
jgi:hypothetical protein